MHGVGPIAFLKRLFMLSLVRAFVFTVFDDHLGRRCQFVGGQRVSVTAILEMTEERGAEA